MGLVTLENYCGDVTSRGAACLASQLGARFSSRWLSVTRFHYERLTLLLPPQTLPQPGVNSLPGHQGHVPRKPWNPPENVLASLHESRR